jgi:hypothetical protein
MHVAALPHETAIYKSRTATTPPSGGSIIGEPALPTTQVAFRLPVCLVTRIDCHVEFQVPHGESETRADLAGGVCRGLSCR